MEASPPEWIASSASTTSSLTFLFRLALLPADHRLDMFRRFICHNVTSNLTIFASVIKLIQYCPLQTTPALYDILPFSNTTFFPSRIFITARKPSWWRLCFHRCVSVHGGCGRHLPPWQTHPPRADTPLGRHPLADTLLWQTPHWADTPPLQILLA